MKTRDIYKYTLQNYFNLGAYPYTRKKIVWNKKTKKND